MLRLAPQIDLDFKGIKGDGYGMLWINGWLCETSRNRSPGQVAGGLAITIGGMGEGAAHFRST